MGGQQVLDLLGSEDDSEDGVATYNEVFYHYHTILTQC